MAIHFILIVGRNASTVNYRNAVLESGHIPIVTDTLNLLTESRLQQDALSPCLLSRIDLLILPGGGDIAPDILQDYTHQDISNPTCFSDIDRELDLVQLAYLTYFYKKQLPVIGICKGMQLINTYFGGTLLSDMPPSAKRFHAYRQYKDNYHTCQYIPLDTYTPFPNLSLLQSLYRTNRLPATINSAHHQCVDSFGRKLAMFQHCNAICEGLIHQTHPIIGLQWHPERLFYTKGSYLKLFLSLFLD